MEIKKHVPLTKCQRAHFTELIKNELERDSTVSVRILGQRVGLPSGRVEQIVRAIKKEKEL